MNKKQEIESQNYMPLQTFSIHSPFDTIFPFSIDGSFAIIYQNIISPTRSGERNLIADPLLIASIRNQSISGL